MARAIDAPVFHVNGDDPEAAVHAVRLAVAYRDQFKSDAIVDLICYRKHGHNEMDDPTFTQPVMYRAIASHAPASRRYAERLQAEGVLEPATLEAMDSEIDERLQAAHRRARATPGTSEVPLGGAWNGLEWAGDDWTADTSVARDRIHSVLAGITRVPEGFHVHPRAARLLEERAAMVAQDRIDWGCGEALALGTLLMDGYNVRLSGQDTGRGTFSHRHAVLHDHENGARWVPLQHLSANQGRFEIIDTMLSEAAVLGFEYGYTTADPNTLVLWEAQFGDFTNVAQVIVDQFLASAESKWRRMSGLVLLLPHGYEGQGPEHSSARLERFLELCADGNLQVCNLTTPAQLFHALRRQHTPPVPQAAGADEPEEPAAAQARGLAGRRVHRRQLPQPDRRCRRRGSGVGALRAPGVREALLRARGGTRRVGRPGRRRSSGSSSSIRSRDRSWRTCSNATRVRARCAGCRRSRPTWADGAVCATASNRSCRRGCPSSWSRVRRRRRRRPGTIPGTSRRSDW